MLVRIKEEQDWRTFFSPKTVNLSQENLPKKWYERKKSKTRIFRKTE